jgi:membrane-bound lytic murein transglycosylase B
VTWAQRPYSRAVLPGLLIFAIVAASILTGAFVVPRLPMTTHRAFTPPDPTTERVPDAPGAGLSSAGASAPAGTATSTPTSGPGAVTRPSDLAAWAGPLAAKLGIPLPAMQAYGFAELAAAATTPNCQLRWTTLAGIGKVESAHGQDNANLAADGGALPPIIGAPLDGQDGRLRIADTDQGKLDLDRTWDHAIGPMQFIPSTWAVYGADADGNGIADINNVNDAALAAAHYLCAGNRNLSLAGDWWAAIMSYNAVQAYGRDVFNAANDYGTRSR